MQAIWAGGQSSGGIHHSDRCGQYLSIIYSILLCKQGFKPSVGSAVYFDDNAMFEGVILLYKTEHINHSGSQKILEAPESAALNWVSW